MENCKRNKKLLHDMATPLSLAILSIRKIIKDNEGQESFRPIREKLNNTLKALHQIEEIHATFKQDNYLQEKELKKNAA